MDQIHGVDCHPNCPTRGGRELEPKETAVAAPIVRDGVDWLSSLADQSVSMTYCDPPYGHGSFGAIDQTWLDSLVAEAWRVTSGIVYFHCDAELLWAMSWPTTPRGMIVWQNGWVSGFKTRSTRFWPKQHQLIVGLARPDWRWRRVDRPVPADYKRRGGGGGGGFVVSDLWTDITPVDQASFSKEKVGWPTQKPVKLLQRLIVGSTDAGDLVIDPTCGSGTTGDAAVGLGRRFAGCDVSPEAISLALQRLA